MQSAVNSKVFPGAVLLVSHKENILLHQAFGLSDIESGQLMQRNSIFDLASLTKPLATSLCLMKLVEKRAIAINNTLSQTFTEIFQPQIGTFWVDKITTIKDKADITIDQLLRHTSGLAAYRPFYKQVIFKPEKERRDFMRQLVLMDPLVEKPGKKQIYSDLGYILLAWIIEKISGYRLDGFAYEELYKPIGVTELFFMPTDIDKQIEGKNFSEQKQLSQNKTYLIDSKKEVMFVPTEICSWRNKMLRAEVHDDNAWAVGGVEGHAGLFGTALGVWRVLIEMMKLIHGEESNLINRDILRAFLEKRHGIKGQSDSCNIYNRFDMVAGFDTPSLLGSSSGRYFSSESIGHLGFTGTSFWLDPAKSIIVILLSNRVHPTRNNQKIREFRPKIHDVIVETLFR